MPVAAARDGLVRTGVPAVAPGSCPRAVRRSRGLTGCQGVSSGETAAQSIDVQSVGGAIHHTAEVGSTGVTGPEYVVLVQSMGGVVVPVDPEVVPVVVGST